MAVCAAAGCTNKQTVDIALSFHRFPLTDEYLLNAWKAAVGVEKVTKWSRLCSEHFTDDSFCKMWSGMTLKRLKANAVPTPVNKSGSQPQRAKSPRRNDREYSVLQLDMQCHPMRNTLPVMHDASSSGDVSCDNFEETSVASSATSDVECINEISETNRLETLIESAANIVSHEHTYSRAENMERLQILEQCESDVTIVPQNYKAGSESDVTIVSQNYRAGSESDVTIVSASSEQESSPVYLKRDLRRTLLQFQKDAYLCDTVLIGEDGLMKAHSVVLAATSDVFKSALIPRDSTKEHVIILPGMELWLIETVVRYVYSGEIQVTTDCMTNERLLLVIKTLTELGFDIVPDMAASSTCLHDDNSVDCADILVGEHQMTVPQCDSENSSDNMSHTSYLGQSMSLADKQETIVTSSDIDNNSRSATQIVADEKQKKIKAAAKRISKVGNKYIRETVVGPEQQGSTTIEKQMVLAESSSDRLCHKCGKVFSNAKKYHMHKKVHAKKQDEAACCPECGKKCANRTTLRSHMYLHTGERPHLCQHCGEGFIQRYSLEVHMTSHHLDVIKDDPNVVLYDCDKCGDKFYNRFRFQRHLSTRCSYSVESKTSRTPDRFLGAIGEKPYACGKCTKRFRLKASLIIHESVHSKHKRMTSKTTEMKHSDSEVAKNVCKTCAKWFKVDALPVQAHEETLDSFDRFECSICGMKLAHRRDSPSTLDNCNELPFTCKTCGAKFMAREGLLVHKRSHTGGKPFHCSICSYQAVNLSWLASHMRVHSGDESYTCSVCNKQFGRRSHLTRHMGIHTGEKPYTCPLCEKGYRNGLDLRLHCRRMHQFELPKYLGRRQLNEEEIDRLVAVDNQFNANSRLVV